MLMKTLLAGAAAVAVVAMAVAAVRPAPAPRITFVIAAGSDPATFGFDYPEAHLVEIDARGDLALQVGSRLVTLPRPHAYQDADGRRQVVPVQFSLNQRGYVTLAFGPYDGHRPLIVVPSPSEAGAR